ncbi:hypothetical protein OG948_54710 (plasmid) [Embleya sp. NBC_00888]|uniref:hypothetical protein n=1 Tax=Embleya sp. NBC_00888 TaxID=2975960 RepID=UPI002F90B68F|nr:hypothetical protein OG948_54710 [Embleya sp. NBC_00888]
MNNPKAGAEPDVQVTKYPESGMRHRGDTKQYYVSSPRDGCVHYCADVLSLNPREAEATVLGLLRAFPVSDANRVAAAYLTHLPQTLEAESLDTDALIRAAVHAARIAARLVAPAHSHRLREALASTLGMAPHPTPSASAR